ncbi:cell wall metabolism sensor histidine kinase WalK [Microbacterium sp. SLBN-146]|uniref:sensor histidine kinase n=1 Tax=Microbacterium sp. SLBN-146 TaxID=2768457 RepID=UPI00116B6CAC|nr:ATP-binding protein [Microbacterium sp. SLBN-146]TQJ31837.1 signal transduction histidine kinase [Microbacterium sp. SLBN-146]
MIVSGADQSATPPRSEAGSGRLDRAIRALIILTLVVNLVFLVLLLVPGDPASTFVNVWLSSVAQWVPVGVFWLVAVRTRFARPEVILAAIGVAFNAAGDTYYAIAMNPSGELPSPSLADVGYLLYYPLTLAALLVLVLRQSPGSLNSALFDGAVASLGAAAVLAAILGPVFTDAASGTDPLSVAIAALYPLFDVLLVTAIVAIFASPVLRLGPRWPFLVVGFLLFAGADIVYALLTREGTYSTGTPLDAAWTLGLACTAIWVDGVTRIEPRITPTISNPRILPVPALAVLASLVVLLIASQTHVPTVALVLAAAAIVLAAVTVMSRHAALARLLERQELLVQQLKELDKSKSDIINTMSHEMRTPLTSILGYLDLVLDDDEALSASTKKRLWIVERNARRLHDLARDMLLLARLESGRATQTARSFEVGRVLRRVEESLRPLAASQGASLTMSAEGGAVIDGDEDQLEQAFMNVIENAVKFTPSSGRIHVDMKPALQSDGTTTVVISITDTGMGIPEDDIPHVFDRFYRATNAQDQAVQGTGLGLAIVREIVQAHHGDLSISSVLGEGTSLRIALPSRDE